jgi:hypothetical protein
MKTEILSPSVHVAIGDKLQSNSTIFINGPDVFLVEAMAAREDGEKLREYVEAELNKTRAVHTVHELFQRSYGRAETISARSNHHSQRLLTYFCNRSVSLS